MQAVTCNRITKTYGGVTALSDVTFDIGAGKVLLVLGPSGAGKTTLLRIISGLEKPDAGSVKIGDTTVTDTERYIEPHRRGVAFVFQRATMWPQMTVLDNVALALHGKGIRKRERRQTAAASLEQMGLAKHLKSYPGTLSGGELQRCAIARALVTNPRVLLLDEPCIALDVHLRKELLATLRILKSDKNVTFIWVSHKYDEALALADKLLLLRDGMMVEYGDAEKVITRPSTRFSASFLSGANILRGEELAPLMGAAEYDSDGLYAIPPGSFVGGANGDPRFKVLSCEFCGGYYACRVEINKLRLIIHLPSRLEDADTVALKLADAPIAIKER